MVPRLSFYKEPKKTNTFKQNEFLTSYQMNPIVGET